MFAEDRASIAAALSTADGVTGYATRPAILTPGAAWPRLARLERGPGNAYAAVWDVVLILGPDEVTATDQIEELLPAITDALLAVLYVESATPVNLQTDAGNILALQITGRSE
jgi:hypothetical protein